MPQGFRLSTLTLLYLGVLFTVFSISSAESSASPYGNDLLADTVEVEIVPLDTLRNDTLAVDTLAVDTLAVDTLDIVRARSLPVIVDTIVVDTVLIDRVEAVPPHLRTDGIMLYGDTVEVAEPWDLDMEGRLSASQVAYRDWAEGGVNTLSMTFGTEGEAARTTPNWSQRYRSRLGFGVIQQDTLEVRKAEDRIRLENSLRYRGGMVFRLFDPTITSSVRTQFTAGFNYDEDPFDDDVDRGMPVKVSDFMSPGNFRQSLGLTYERGDWFEQRLAFAGQENVVVIPRLRPLYGLREDQMVRFQGGMESVTEIDRVVAENIRIRSTLNVFSAFDDFLDPDIIWESVLGMRVNEWLSVDLEVTAIYEPDVSPDLQLKEVLSLGVSVVFI